MTIDIDELRSMAIGAQFEGFANSVIHSLLDRLEAAEKELVELRVDLLKQQSLTDAAQQLAEVAQRRADKLMANLEAAERECDQFKADWLECLKLAEEAKPIIDRQRSEIDALRAKIAEMERQKPAYWGRKTQSRAVARPFSWASFQLIRQTFRSTPFPAQKEHEMPIDTNELRRKINSTDVVDHIDLHASIKPLLSEILDRLEAAEKERDECNSRRLEAADHFAAQTALMKEKCDALRTKIEQMEKQEPVAEWVDGAFDQYPHLRWREPYKAIVGAKLYTKLYALPGAQGEEK